MENNILTLQIEPLDTLFFRDGKPFSMGDDSWADGVFPPAPSVIYGAIRSWLLANVDTINVDNIINETSDLEILDFYFLINGETVLSLPYDYGTKKEKDDQIRYDELKDKKINVERFSTIKNRYTTSINNSTLFYNQKDYILEFPINNFISVNNLISYLKNEIDIKKIKIHNLKNEIEAKIGIKRTNETLSAEDGNLYRVGLNRLENLKFILRIKSKHLSKQHHKFLKLGGEGKIVFIDEFLEAKKGAKQLRIKTELKTKELLVYIATPAIFNNGTPDINKYLKTTATLVASVVGKTVNIGGFDMKEKRPKNMYKAVPAGSIYLYKLEEEIEIDKFQGDKISDELNEQGFGIAYFGTYKIDE